MRNLKIIIVLFQFSIINFQLTNAQSLRQLADKDGINYGCAAFPTDEVKYNNTIKEECNIIVPENCMKFMYTEPKPGEFDFKDADKLVKFAIDNHIKLRGHCLVWHSQLPKWVEEGTFTKRELLSIMKRHIKGLVGHFKGKILEWDVVNEAIDDSTHKLRDTKWRKIIGG